MPKRSSTPDLNQIAAKIVSQSTEERNVDITGKNPAAVALGRLGGLKGGKARAESLTAKRRKEIARRAAAKRWKSSGKRPRR